MNKIEMLASDFKRWGEPKVRLVLKGVQKYGVIFDFWWNDKKTKG